MATKLLSVPVGAAYDKYHSGKPYNVYSSYANAIAHGVTGLVDSFDFDHITGVVNSTKIAQVAKVTGVLPDANGYLTFGVDNGADIYIITEGLGVPIKVPTGAI